MGLLMRKAIFKAKKNFVNYFPQPVRTLPREITIKYKATTVFLKPAAAGNGIRAGNVLNSFFKKLGIKDVTAKIIGSRNRLNVLKAVFKALDKLTERKREYVI